MHTHYRRSSLWCCALAVAAAAMAALPASAWTTTIPSPRRVTALGAALPEGYQEFGEFVIRKAGKECGIEDEEDLGIEWKAGRIVVTVKGSVYVSAGSSDDEDQAEVLDDETESIEPADDDDDSEVSVDAEEETPPSGVDVTALARAINAGLDDGDGVGFAIAEAHEIEVTTPGASDELIGQVMFDAYKGFDVSCRQIDPKTKKIKTIEGRLVERNQDFTVINIKGRMKKMRNDTVLTVTLPKAKKEKGGGGGGSKKKGGKKRKR